MGPSIVWRRAATAVGIYGSAILGILATVVAARELTKLDFSRFALVFAVAGLLQLFLDLTVEEVVVKFGNRYIARGDWPRFHRLLRLALAVKVAGGALGAVGIVLTAFAASWIWAVGGIRDALLVAALLPFVQAAEGVGYAVLLLRNRYDVRGGLLLFSMALRLAAVAVGASMGLVQTFVAIVLAQCISTATVSAVALAAVHRFPRAAPQPLGTDRRPVAAFAVQSSVSSGLTSLRGLLPTVLIGIVARPIEVAHFRIAQAPQTAFATLSAPVRLVLLAEQTRDVERGRGDLALALVRRYVVWTTLLVAVTLPLLWLAVPTLVRWIYGARWDGAANPVRLMVLGAGIQLVFGWAKSFPVSIGRPELRTVAQVLEIVTLVPLVLILGRLYGASGAAGAFIVSSIVFAVFWSFQLVRLHSGPLVNGAGA
jgi:O-antigen/teichoic acid export membrane protein